MLALCIILTLLLILNLIYFKFDFVCPSVIFNLMFVISAFDLQFMTAYWDINIKFDTVFIICLGVFVFFLSSVFAYKIKVNRPQTNNDYVTDITSKRFIIYISMYFVSFFWTIFYRINAAGFGFSFGSIFSTYSEAIGDLKLDELSNLPLLLKLLVLICTSMSFVYCYLFSQYLGKFKKISIKLLVLVIISCLYLIIVHKRGTFIVYSINLFCQLILQTQKYDAKKLLKKLYLYIFLAVIILVISFNSIALIMGRKFGEENAFALFSIYLGGPILNLNMVVDNLPIHPNLFLSETFHNLYMAMYKYTGLSIFDCYNTKFFRASMGHATGNVYTIFYDFYFDAGVIGIIFFTAIVGYISCRLYKMVCLNASKNVLFFSVLFTYIYSLVWRSFFSNSFYEWIQFSTLETLLIWYVSSYTLSSKLKISKNKLIIRKM